MDERLTAIERLLEHMLEQQAATRKEVSANTGSLRRTAAAVSNLSLVIHQAEVGHRSNYANLTALVAAGLTQDALRAGQAQPQPPQKSQREPSDVIQLPGGGQVEIPHRSRDTLLKWVALVVFFIVSHLVAYLVPRMGHQPEELPGVSSTSSSTK